MIEKDQERFVLDPKGQYVLRYPGAKHVEVWIAGLIFGDQDMRHRFDPKDFEYNETTGVVTLDLGSRFVDLLRHNCQLLIKYFPPEGCGTCPSCIDHKALHRAQDDAEWLQQKIEELFRDQGFDSTAMVMSRHGENNHSIANVMVTWWPR